MTKQEAKTLEAVERQCKAANCGCVPEGWKLVPLDRSYDMRAEAIIAYNTAIRDGADRDDALKAAWEAEYNAAPAAPTEGARVCIGEPDYKARFETMVYMIGEITQALGISDDEAACANGNDVILNAIRELKDERNNLCDDAYALAGEGARDAGVGTAVCWIDPHNYRAMLAQDLGCLRYLTREQNADDDIPLYDRPDPLLAEAVEALREISEQADDSYALGSGNHRRVTLGRIHERASIVLNKVQAAKEGAS